MRLPRPHIPISVRVQVAERQMHERGLTDWSPGMPTGFHSKTALLDYYLRRLFGDGTFELHHRPALVNRERYRRGGKTFYKPDANDPNHLVYLLDDEHDIETRVRGVGAQLSDLGQARKRKRAARKLDKKRRISKIPARVNPWPKGRKLRSRR